MNTIYGSRRNFLVGMVSAAAIPVWASPSPLRLRIGAMTDNHLHAQRPETHRKTKACFDLFRREQVDVVMDTGDIVDRSDMNELRFFRSCFDTTFAGTKTVPFFGIANHDLNYVPETGRTVKHFNNPETIAAAVAALKMPSPNPCMEVKGYQFVNIRQFENVEVLEENLRKAAAANVGNRPIFVMTHEPPFNTTSWTIYWSSRKIRKVLDKYPQVVSLSGHIHDSIVFAANIWQGEFTAINLGAHAQYSNPIDGEAVILDVYDDRIDVRRYEAVSGREIGADDRWSVPLPHDPKNGPYRPAVRAATMPLPCMPGELGFRFEKLGKGERCKLTFRSAEPKNVTMDYRVSFEVREEQGWRHLSSTYWRRPQELVERPVMNFEIPALMLDAGRRHRVTVTPIDSFGRDGKPGMAEFDASECPLKPLSEKPFTFAAVTQGTRPGGKPLTPSADGWYGPCVSMFAELPAAAVAALKGKKRAYCVADIGSDQKGVPACFAVRWFPDGKNGRDESIGERVYSSGGVFASNRYVWRIRTEMLTDGDGPAGVCLIWGDPGRFRFNSIALYA